MKGRELPAKRQFFEIFLEKFRGRCKPRLILSKRSLLHGGSLLKPPCQRMGVTPLLRA